MLEYKNSGFTRGPTQSQSGFNMPDHHLPNGYAATNEEVLQADLDLSLNEADEGRHVTGRRKPVVAPARSRRIIRTTATTSTPSSPRRDWERRRQWEKPSADQLLVNGSDPSSTVSSGAAGDDVEKRAPRLFGENGQPIATPFDLNRSVTSNYSRIHSPLRSSHHEDVRPVGDSLLSMARSLDADMLDNSILNCLKRSAWSGLVTLSVLSFFSILLIIPSSRLLENFSKRQLNMLEGDGLLLTGVLREKALDAGAALCSLLIGLYVSCLTVTSLHAYFSCKLLRRHQAEHRLIQYLRACAGTRFIAVYGFFLSLPVYLLVIFLYVIVYFTATAAIISAAIILLALFFSIGSALHSGILWRQERIRAENDSVGGKGFLHADPLINMSQLSTLV